MNAFRCPICEVRFSSLAALEMHALRTQRHPSLLEEVWRLRFLLAEAERNAKIYCQQRNEAREQQKAAEVASKYKVPHPATILLYGKNKRYK